MKKPVELYESHYPSVEADVYRSVRADTYDEDLGQASWMTAAECDELCAWLGVGPGRRVLEVACGSGGASVRMAQRHGATVVGVDVNEAAVAAAADRARSQGVQDRADFRVADADRPLPFPDGSFDLLFCNDSINHMRDRRRVLEDWSRVLRTGGRLLYTDPIVVTGCLSNAEMETRSSIGFFLFTPPGHNETLLGESGLQLVRTADLTEAVATTSLLWHEARRKRRAALCEREGEGEFEGIQRFLETVHRLASERRLSRFAFVADKKSAGDTA